MKAWTPDRLLSLCQPLGLTGTLPEDLGALQTDSRNIQPGDVFIAVKGPDHDGHAYIPQAIAAGARVVIATSAPSSTEGGILVGDLASICWMQVKDTRRLVGPLALAYFDHPEHKLVMIGVTGTNGKTTVSTLIYQVLQTLGYTCGLIGTVEKRIGDARYASALTTPGPLELAKDLHGMHQAGCTHVVMEVSSHALEQDRVRGIDYRVACFTNLTQDHLDYHGTMEAYAAAKALLFQHLSAQSTAIVNADDSWAEAVCGNTTATRWDIGFKAGQAGVILEHSAQGLTLDIDGTLIHSPLCGRFNAYNVAMAYMACIAAGASPSNVASALATATGAPGRLQRVNTTAHTPTVFVDYAHTPDALENVLRTAAELVHTEAPKAPRGVLRVVFGCGGNRDRTKRPKMGNIAYTLADVVYVTSDNPRMEAPEAIIDDILEGIPSAGLSDSPKGSPNTNKVKTEVLRPKAIALAIAEAGVHDVIVIAGKGHETYQEIRGVRYDMNDSEIAQEALRTYPQPQEAP